MITLSESARSSLSRLTRQPDGSEIVIGNPGIGLFLALPEDAVEVIDLLVAGCSINAAQKIYCKKYGEIPDVEGLLEALAAKGLLSIEDSGSHAPLSGPVPGATARYHFIGIPEGVARRLFSLPALVFSALICLLALAAVIAEPQVLPTRKSLFFKENVTLMLLLTMAVGVLTTFLHEMAHLTAARAKGVSCRLGISNRLWVLVAETDMTGVWALPKRERYLPILAGPILDLVSAAVLIIILFGNTVDWVSLPSAAIQFIGALAFVYMLRLVWQLFLFVRTDFYFIYATCFGCKNLMADTQDYLRNLVTHVFKRGRVMQQSHIPHTEMRAIQFYALLWLVGRALAFAVLFFVTLPLAMQYVSHIATAIAHPDRGSLYQVVDAVAISTISLLFGVAGFGLWVRSLMNSRRRNGIP